MTPADPNARPPFTGHRRYYLFVKIAVALFALWLLLHFTGVFP